MFRWRRRSVLLFFLISLTTLLFFVIGPINRGATRAEINFLSGWSVRLGTYFSPNYLTSTSIRKESDRVLKQIVKNLTDLNDVIAFELPEDLTIPKTWSYPNLQYKSIRSQRFERMRAEIEVYSVSAIPFPREVSSNLNRDFINRNLMQIYLLEELVATFKGLSFRKLRISEVRETKNQLVACRLIQHAQIYSIGFDFTAPIEEILLWIDRLRTDRGFYYLTRIEMTPDAEQPSAIRVKTEVTTIGFRQRDENRLGF